MTMKDIVDFSQFTKMEDQIKTLMETSKNKKTQKILRIAKGQLDRAWTNLLWANSRVNHENKIEGEL